MVKKKNHPSPSGLGFHAGPTRLRTIATGADGNEWIVTKDIRGRHFWKRYSAKPQKKRYPARRKYSARLTELSKREKLLRMNRFKGKTFVTVCT